MYPQPMFLSRNKKNNLCPCKPGFYYIQGPTNPLPSCPGQVQILAEQVIFYFICPEKCIEYIGNIVIPSHFQDAVECRASG